MPEERLEERPSELPLRIVLPAALGEAALLRRLTLAVEATRAELSRRVRWCALALWEAGEDDAEADWWAAKADGLRMAAEELESCLMDGLRAWDQLGAQPDHSLARAVRVDTPPLWAGERPEFPLPDEPEDQSLGSRLVQAVRKELNDLVQQAISANEQAHKSASDGTATSPESGEHMAQAKVWAMAADRLETVLAQVHGQAREHQRFTEEHGHWLSGLVFP